MRLSTVSGSGRPGLSSPNLAGAEAPGAPPPRAARRRAARSRECRRLVAGRITTGDEASLFHVLRRRGRKARVFKRDAAVGRSASANAWPPRGPLMAQTPAEPLTQSCCPEAVDPRNPSWLRALVAVRCRASERPYWLYTQGVGGSIPSPPTCESPANAGLSPSKALSRRGPPGAGSPR